MANRYTAEEKVRFVEYYYVNGKHAASAVIALRNRMDSDRIPTAKYLDQLVEKFQATD